MLSPIFVLIFDVGVDGDQTRVAPIKVAQDHYH